MPFLSTPSARRATVSCGTILNISWEFLSTPSARRATRSPSAGLRLRPYFYPRPPRGGRQSYFDDVTETDEISIHALREEGDLLLRRFPQEPGNFYPRPPRGGRPPQIIIFPASQIFLSTPSARRATSRSWFTSNRIQDFYPRPPRGGRRFHRRGQPLRRPISIHALREEGDPRMKYKHTDTTVISIHALREEGDT